MDRDKMFEKLREKKETEANKDQLDTDTMKAMNFAEKIALIKSIGNEIIANSERKYRKLKDLLLFTQEPKEVDVVLKAIEQLAKVFKEIIPSYRIREDASLDMVDDQTGAKKGIKLSKDVKTLRDFESSLI